MKTYVILIMWHDTVNTHTTFEVQAKSRREALKIAWTECDQVIDFVKKIVAEAA